MNSFNASTFLNHLVTLAICSTLVWQAHAAPGDVDLTFDAGSTLNGSPYAIAPQSDGKIIIGGDFTTVAGLVRNRIARLNPDGTGDPSFNPGTGANAHVRSVVLQPDGKVLVGGWFTAIDGVSRNRIARLNADGSLDATFDPGIGADGMVFFVALQPDGKVLIAGYFTHVNGASRNYLARLNADGSVDTGFNPDANDYLYAIVLEPDGKILVGGLFTNLSGVSINRIARLNPDGSLDISFNPGSGVDYFGVTALALQPDGRVLIGGIFGTVNGTRHENIARLNADGSVDASFTAAASDEVGAIAVQTDGRLVVGGQFYTINGRIHSYLARLQADGSLDDSFNPPLQLYPPGVAALAVEPHGTILVSAGFFGVNGLGPKNLVRLNADGSVNNSLNPSTGINGYGVFSGCVQPDGKILVAGNFGDVNNLRRQGIARFESDGRLDEGFDPGQILNTAFYSVSNPVVYSVALQPDGRIIVGGGFTNINGTSRNNIARLNADGSVDTSFDPGIGADYNVYQLVLQPDGKVLITGGFTSVNGVARELIARLNADGSLDASFNPHVGFVSDLAVQPDGRIIVVGYAPTNHTIQYYVMRINMNGDHDPTFDPGSGPNNRVSSVALQSDGKILVSGDFTEFNGISRPGMARLNSDGGVDLTFNPVTTNSSTGLLKGTLLQPDGKILVGGAFMDADNMLHQVIARLNPDGSMDGSFTQCNVLGTAAVAVQPDSKLVLYGSFWSINGVPRFAIARLLGDAPVITTQPASRTNAVGTTAVFSVVASGAAPLSYQWYKDGVALSDRGRISGSTTATLTLTGVRLRDGGSYTVAITNLAGKVVSDAALLQVRRQPIARIQVSPLAVLSGVTNLLVISPNNTNALVVLDGSRSRGTEGIPLQYSWREGANIFTTGVTVTNQFALGVHTINLIVDDGISSGISTVTFEVIKPSKAVGFLIAQVERSHLPRQVQRQLLPRLRLASEVFDRGHFRSGINLLRVFQFTVRVRVGPLAPILASDLIRSAQEITNALVTAETLPTGGSQGRINTLVRQPDGHARLQVSVTSGMEYAIEASTDLLDWEVIGVFQDDGTGSFDFEDAEATQFPARFYRIVTLAP